MLLDNVIKRVTLSVYLLFHTTYPIREESLLKEIQPEELHQRMQDPSFLDEAQFIDVREPDEVYALMFQVPYFY